MKYDLIDSTSNETKCVCSTRVLEDEVYDKTFWLFLFMNLIISLGVLSAQCLIDSYVLYNLPDGKRHHFGFQRLWGSVGFGLGTLLAGFLKGT